MERMSRRRYIEKAGSFMVELTNNSCEVHTMFILILYNRSNVEIRKRQLPA